MSFRSLKNPLDYEMYKKEYLDSLALQVTNNNNNYNANLMYQKTGQLPITPTDTRGIEEKFSDLLQLEVAMRQNLTAITDAKNSMLIMEDLVKDKDLLYFSVSNFPSILEYVKKNFALGIQYPIFMSYIRKRIDDVITSTGLLEKEKLFVVASNDVTVDTMNTLKSLCNGTSTDRKIKTLMNKIIPVLLSNNELNNINSPKVIEKTKKLAQLNFPTNQQFLQFIIDIKNTNDEDEIDDIKSDIYELLDEMDYELNPTKKITPSFIPQSPPPLQIQIKPVTPKTTPRKTTPPPPTTPPPTTYKQPTTPIDITAKTLDELCKLVPSIKHASPHLKDVLLSPTDIKGLNSGTPSKSTVKKVSFLENVELPTDESIQNAMTILRNNPQNSVKINLIDDLTSKLEDVDFNVLNKKIRTKEEKVENVTVRQNSTNPIKQSKNLQQSSSQPEFQFKSPSSKYTGKGLKLTKRQQDTHKIDILRGEILAGNTGKKTINALNKLLKKK